MTVETTDRKESFAGGQGSLTFSFRALEDHPEYIKVLTVSSGTETLLTYTTDYTVAITAGGVGGVVTVSPSYSTSYTYTVYRETAKTQETDYDDYNQFPSDTLEEDLDRRCCVEQEEDEDNDRAVKVNISSSLSGSALYLPTAAASNLIGWNAAADGFANVVPATLDFITLDTDGTLAANSDANVSSQKAVKTYADTKAPTASPTFSGQVSISGPETDSQVTIDGSFGDGITGDNRALGIISTIYPDPLTGARSCESINCRPSYVLPTAGNIASIEGYHIDMSGAWSSWATGLWDPSLTTLTTVGTIAGFRMRGLSLPTAGGTVENVYGIYIDANLGGGTVTNYNIFSDGATSINRINGTLTVYGNDGHLIGGGGPGANGAAYVGVSVNPKVTTQLGASGGSSIVKITGSAAPSISSVGIGMLLQPTFTVAASGAHTAFSSAYILPPTITPSGGTVANITTLRLDGTPSGGTSSNYSIWSTAGLVRHGQYGAGDASFDSNGIMATSSDERLKDVKGDFNTGLNEILSLNPVLYKYNKKSGLETKNVYCGFLAQDVKQYIPEAVGIDRDGYYSLSNRPIIAALVNAVKDLMEEIDDIRDEVGLKIKERLVEPIENDDRIIKPSK